MCAFAVLDGLADHASAQGGAPTVTAITPPAGPSAGGDGVTIRGSGFAPGATVTIGGAPARNIAVVDSGTITAITPAAAVGAASIVVTNSGGRSGTLLGGYEYLMVVPFSDDPLQPGRTALQARHVVELRQAVDNVRLVAGLTPAPWTDPTLRNGSATLVRAVHLLELRSRLEEALIALGYVATAYTDPDLSAGPVALRAVHIQELRDRLRVVSPMCAYALSPTIASSSAAGDSGRVTVSAALGCRWAAGANVAWITLDAASGNGSAMIGFTAAANPTTSARTGVITVAGKTLTVSQAAGSRSIILTHPANNSTFGSGESVTLSASVDPAIKTSRVDFFVDGALVGTSSGSGSVFESSWTSAPVGSRIVHAVAVGAVGGPTSSVPVAVAVTNCPAIDPNDSVPDDGGLQCRLNSGGTIELRAGSPGYIVNGSPIAGFANGRGLYITRHGTRLTAVPSASGTRARIVAGPDLWGDILRTDPAMDATGVHDIEIARLIFDGRVDVLVGGQALRIHRDQCDVRRSGNLTLNVHGLRFHDNETRSAMCGSGFQLIGMPNDEATPVFPFIIERSHVASNGRDEKLFSPGGHWADGLTALWCDRGTIVNNTFTDNTDIDLVIGGSRNCTVAFNTIAHVDKYAYAGLNIGTSGVRSSHAGSSFTNNTIYTGSAGSGIEPQECVPYPTPDPGTVEDQLSIGILIGSHPWEPSVWVSDGGRVSENRSHHNVTNLVVDGVCAGTPNSRGNCPAASAPGVAITGNNVYCPRGTNGKGTCTVGGFNFAVNPDHVGGTAGWQAGAENLWYDSDACSASGPVP